MPCLQVQCDVHEVEGQQESHSLDYILDCVEESHYVVTDPQSVEIDQLVQEEFAENPVSKVVPGKVVGHEDLDATVV